MDTEALDQAIRDAVDGLGSVVELDDVHEADVVARASAAGLGVLAIDATAAAMPVAFGSFLAALPPVEGRPDAVLAAAGLPPRLAGWLRRLVSERIAALARASALLVLLHHRAALDEVARRELDALIRSTGGPVVWVFTGPETEEAPAPDPAPELEDPLVRRVLDVVASTPIGLSAAELADASGLSAPAAAAVFDDPPDGIAVWRGRGVLRDADLRDRLLAAMPASVRRGVQRAVLGSLDAGHVPVVALADLALDCARPGDRAAVSLLADAMYVLRDADPESAVAYGSAAVTLVAGNDDLLAALAWQLLPLLWRTARVSEARQLAARVFSESNQSEAEAQTLFWLARFEGSADRALRYTEAALGFSGISLEIRARLLAVHLRLLSTLGRVHDVDRLLPSALIEARAAGDLESMSRLQSCDSIRHFYRGAYEESRRLDADAVDSWARSGSPDAEWMPEMIWSPHLQLQLGDPAGALARIDGLLSGLGDRSAAFAVRFLRAERSLALLTLGRLDDASDEVVIATADSERLWSLPPGVSDRLQAIAVSVRLKIALHRGDAAELEELRRVLRASAPPADSETRRRIDAWTFLLDDAQGTTDPGTRSIDPAAVAPVSWLDPSDEVLLVRALLIHGGRKQAVDLAERAAVRVGTSEAHPLALTIAAHLEGLVSWRAEPLEAAVEGWAALGRPLLAAAARSDAGVRLRDLGDPRGETLLHRAHDELVALGAHRDAWRIRGMLRRGGVILAAQRVMDAGALTATERRVVDRAVLGFTAGRIAEELSISPHTVTTHLRHIYAKLGVTSRRELIAWSARLRERG